ncbi:hypothetical protein B0H13DRAFT_1882029 [Mycena leptocephala]|nr:hypothetical protein B0H13DRAFT_1882029 [Mycena leptocephala]
MDSVAATVILPSAVLDAPRKNIERGSTEDIVFEGQAVRLQGVQLVFAKTDFGGQQFLLPSLTTVRRLLLSAQLHRRGFQSSPLSSYRDRLRCEYTYVLTFKAREFRVHLHAGNDFNSRCATVPSDVDGYVPAGGVHRSMYKFCRGKQERSSGERNDVAGADCSCAGPLKFGEEVADHSSDMVNRRYTATYCYAICIEFLTQRYRQVA